MARVIYKYKLDIGTNRLRMPPEARLLSVRMQHEVITLWAVVQENNARPFVQRQIEVVGTGWAMEGNGLRDVPFVDTVVSGEFVWHVFDFGES